MSKRTSNIRKTVISDMYCTKCGKKGLSIPRMTGDLREPGHLKELYCFHCKETVNHSEVRGKGRYTYEVFKEEFELGRFKNGTKRPICELDSCKNKECPYNKHGKCWNDNHSFQCEKRVGNITTERLVANG